MENINIGYLIMGIMAIIPFVILMFLGKKEEDS